MPQLLADLSQDALARELRAAVLGSDHAQAHRVAGQYAQAVASDWTRMTASERASSGIPKQATELLTWAREITIMQHAMSGQHLSALEMAHRYLAARATYASTTDNA
jgi:hypothetical protein